MNDLVIRCAVAERVKPRLPQLLRDVIDERVRMGFEKYGQTLGENVKPPRAKAVHLAQEYLDALMYLEWLKQDTPEPVMRIIIGNTQRIIVSFLRDLTDWYPDLTVQDLLHQEGHSAVPAAIQTVRELERMILQHFPVELTYTNPLQGLHVIMDRHQRAMTAAQDVAALFDAGLLKVPAHAGTDMDTARAAIQHFRELARS
jgi:hypothetical protein